MEDTLSYKANSWKIIKQFSGIPLALENMENA